ncbi:MAG: glutamate racemase [Clostridia bacterium]|nr:glutamate racemase [Clostridia bacterium]
MKDLIGIMDSGVGGVSVLRVAAKLLPNENFLFFGDNKNAPYGPRSLKEIRALSEQAVNRLLDAGVKALVIACNTITSAYAGILRETAQIPVIGMEPAVKPASLARSGGKILAMATKATLTLDKFTQLMELYGEGVIPVEGKGLVEIVEGGKANSPEARAALEALFAPYMHEKIDGVVLGCTHYPFLRGQIESIFPEAGIFDGLEGTVRQLKRRLEETNSLTRQTCPGKITFESSGGEEKIALMKKLFEA